MRFKKELEFLLQWFCVALQARWSMATSARLGPPLSRIRPSPVCPFTQWSVVLVSVTALLPTCDERSCQILESTLNCFHSPPPRGSGPGNALPGGRSVLTEMLCEGKTLGRQVEIPWVMPQRCSGGKAGGWSSDDTAGEVQLAGNTGAN